MLTRLTVVGVTIRRWQRTAGQFDESHKRITSGDTLQVLRNLTDPSMPLPWDIGRITQTDTDKLGGMLGTLLWILKRDARERATVQEFRSRVTSLVAIAPNSGNASTSRGDDLHSSGTSEAGSAVAPPSTTLGLGASVLRYIEQESSSESSITLALP